MHQTSLPLSHSRALQSVGGYQGQVTNSTKSAASHAATTNKTIRPADQKTRDQECKQAKPNIYTPLSSTTMWFSSAYLFQDLQVPSSWQESWTVSLIWSLASMICRAKPIETCQPMWQCILKNEGVSMMVELVKGREEVERMGRLTTKHQGYRSRNR